MQKGKNPSASGPVNYQLILSMSDRFNLVSGKASFSGFSMESAFPLIKGKTSLNTSSLVNLSPAYPELRNLTGVHRNGNSSNSMMEISASLQYERPIFKGQTQKKAIEFQKDWKIVSAIGTSPIHSRLPLEPVFSSQGINLPGIGAEFVQDELEDIFIEEHELGIEGIRNNPVWDVDCISAVLPVKIDSSFMYGAMLGPDGNAHLVNSRKLSMQLPARFMI